MSKSLYIAPRVKLPGEFYFLEWHEYNEGHNVLVCRSQESLVKTFEVILDRHPHAIAKKQYIGHTVIPPNWFIDNVYRIRMEEAIRNLKLQVVCAIQEINNSAKSIDVELNNVVICKKFISNDSDNDKLDSYYNNEWHNDCLICDGGRIILNNETWENVVQRTDKDLWLIPKNNSPTADDKKKICVILGGSNDIKLFGPESDSYYTLERDPVMIFQGEIVPIQDEIKQAIKNMKNFMTKKEARKAEIFRLEQLARKNKRIEDGKTLLTSLFGEK